MRLIPYKQETIVSSYTLYEVVEVLNKITTPPVRSKQYLEKNAVFIGTIRDNEFKISLKVDAPENFLPIITGRVEETSMGCILFLQFKLFFSSFLFLVFWSVICLAIALFFYLAVGETVYAFISLTAGVVNYVITLTAFQRKVKESHNVLMNALKMN
ncbi:MAG: hypothetical protein R3345_13945 [Fulvivirga sp.]|nr:hypothetical protein [Fulvivirga sp.]